MSEVEVTEDMAELPAAMPRAAGRNVPSIFVDMQQFADSQRVAKMLTSSALVPKEFQGQQGMANTMIALEMAGRMGASPLAVMQNLYIVHGKPAWSSQFLVAALNATGRYSSVAYDVSGEGDERGCVAWVKDKSTGERIEGPRVTIGMAKAEGWATKNGSKWKTMPDLMLRYRAATFLVRTVAPELTMGLHTAEEIRDIEVRDMGRADVIQERHGGISALKAAMEGPAEPEPDLAQLRDALGHCKTIEQVDEVIAAGRKLKDSGERHDFMNDCAAARLQLEVGEVES